MTSRSDLHRVRTLRAADFAGPSGQTVAWEEPAVRAAWMAHVRRGRILMAAGVAVLAVMTVVFIVVDSKDDALLSRSVETSATVTGGGYGGRYSTDHVNVEYVVNDVVHTGRINDEYFDDHPEGSTITIVYDPNNPEKIRTWSNANHSTLTDFILFMGTLVGVFVLVSGLLASAANLRWRRWLRSHAALDAEVSEGYLSRILLGDAWVLRIDAPHLPPVATRLTGTKSWFEGGPTFFGANGFDGPAMVCAGSGRKLVVFDPDVTIPVEVRLPRSARTAKKWLDCF